MCYATGLDRSYAFQFSWLYTQMIEQPDAVSEQQGYQVNMDFVHQSRVETLLQDTGGAYDDILVSRCFLGVTNGAFNPIGDKGERRSFVDPFLRDAMGDNKTR